MAPRPFTTFTAAALIATGVPFAAAMSAHAAPVVASAPGYVTDGGTTTTYVTRPGDTLRRVAAVFDVPWREVHRANRGKVPQGPHRRLRPRTHLTIRVGPITGRAPAPAVTPEPVMTPAPTATSPIRRPVGGRPYFKAADWLWAPIPAAPSLDPQSRAMAAALARGRHVSSLPDYGVTLRGPSGITASTPRYDVRFDMTGEWGPDPFGAHRMPIPPGTPVPPGTDGHVAVADPTSGRVYNLWRADPERRSASWGSVTPLDGDGREFGGSSTGSGIARFAAVVRAAEIAAGEIPHALFFSTDIARRAEFRFPATKTDGSSGASVTIPEGARVQLDPSIDVRSIPGITRAEIAVAEALQTYGAYAGDNGGTRMAFMFEYAPGSDVYEKAGMGAEYYDFPHIPWGSLRVLSDWNG